MTAWRRTTNGVRHRFLSRANRADLAPINPQGGTEHRGEKDEATS
jgi:hypothetical protein